MKNKLLLSTALVSAVTVVTPVFAQSGSGVKQGGNVTPLHVACWQTNGVIGDCGTAAVPYATTFGTYGSGPTFCVNSGPIGAPYNQMCFGATQNGGGVISMYNYGGATGGLTFNLNGTIFNPFSGSFAPQSPNTFLGGPASGSTSATPSFRSIINADLFSITALPSVTIPSPTFTGTVTFPDLGTATSSGFGSVSALGVKEPPPSSGNINISGLYEVGGTQIGYGNGLTGFGTAAPQNTGTIGAVIGFLNGNNTYSGNDTFTGTLAFPSVSSVSCLSSLVINSLGLVGTGNCPGVATTVEIGTTLLTGGTNNYLVYNNNGTVGNISLDNATIGITGGQIVVSNTTINGTTCTPGQSCAPERVSVVYTGSGTENMGNGSDSWYSFPGANAASTQAGGTGNWPVSGTFSNMYVSISGAPGTSASYTFTLYVNGSATSISCVISGSSAKTCSDTSDIATITAGEAITLEAVPAGTPNNEGLISAALKFQTP